MVHIVLMILKVIGILLLVMLGILLLIIISVLFVPVCYQGHIKKEGDDLSDILAEGRISWLLGAISARVCYENQKTDFLIRIFGIPLSTYVKAVKWLKREKSEKKDEQVLEPAPEKSSRNDSIDQESISEREKSPAQGEEKEKTSEKAEAELEKAGESIGKNGKKAKENRTIVQFFLIPVQFLLEILRCILKTVLQILELPFRIAGRAEKVASKIKELKKKIQYWKKFLKSQTFKRALAHCKSELFLLIRKTMPQKVKGFLKFGFDDPSLTGEVLGILGIFYGRIPQKLRIIPVFDREILLGDITVRGHLFGATLFGIAWRIFWDKEIRKVIRKFKNKEA
ncbi:MAG: DUF2953 domain-containing protein [Fusicatenibacter sp.]|nr:DUF2953 domain-containing protein [Fusicatenibacter sp.]